MFFSKAVPVFLLCFCDPVLLTNLCPLEKHELLLDGHSFKDTELSLICFTFVFPI